MIKTFNTLFVSLCLFAICCPPLAALQTETSQSQTSATSQFPKLEAFLALRVSIRRNETKIEDIFGNIPIGFPDLQKRFENEMMVLEEETQVLREQVKQSTIDAYLENPNANKIVNSEMINTIKFALNPVKKWHKFDPKTALEVAQIIIENGIENPQIQYLAYRACLALNDFAKAEQYMSNIQNSKVPINSDLIDDFEQLKNKWIRELEIRRLEKANDDLPRVKLETTEGDIVIELFENHAPQTVANFVNLVEREFYNGQIFHLVQPGKYAQTGCPDGNGRGGPGYQIYCECYRENIRDHFAGSVSMSHTGTRDTGDSKFFFLHQPDSSLDGKFTVFGRVIEGINALYALNACDKTGVIPDAKNASKIISATVVRKRKHEYVPTRVSQ